MMRPICDHLDRAAYARGLCKPCYNRLRRREDPTVGERERARSRAWGAKHGKTRTKRRRAYQRNHWLRAQYGISAERYDELLSEQAGVCAICSTPPEEKPLHVDHDHSTSAVRGLLCGACNRALGLFKDRPETLLTAAAYLGRKTEAA